MLKTTQAPLDLSIKHARSKAMVTVKEKSKKRPVDVVSDPEVQRKQPKKRKDAQETHAQVASVSKPEEVDFPRGGGTSFTAAEYKAIRSEALKEMRDEVFKVSFDHLFRPCSHSHALLDVVQLKQSFQKETHE